MPDSTPAPADGLAVDRFVHEPARMAILSVLSGVEEADFLFLQRILGLTKGNLSAHLSKLEAVGLVAVSKAFDGKVPRTTLRLTQSGAAARTRHLAQLERLSRLGEGLSPAATRQERVAGLPVVRPVL